MVEEFATTGAVEFATTGAVDLKKTHFPSGEISAGFFVVAVAYYL